MGFGLLILGYFLTFAFTISQAYFFADVIGALVMLYAFTKLSEYNRYFRGAAAAGMLFTLLALTSGVLLSMHMLTSEGMLDILLDAAKSCLHWGCMCSCCWEPAGLPKGQTAESWQIVPCGIW